MKNLSNYLVGLSAFILFLYAVSLTLPTQVEVRHSELLYSSPEEIYSQFENLPNWKYWSVWNKEFVYHPSETEKSEGSWFSWKPKAGKKYVGTVEVIHTYPNDSIELRIKASSIDSVKVLIKIEKTEEGALAHWNSYIRLHGSGARLMGYFLKRWLIRDVKISLRNINRHLYETGRHTGWLSETYSFVEQTNNQIYVIYDTVKDAFIDSVKHIKFRQIKDTLTQHYQFAPTVYFYRKISPFQNEKSVFVFGADFDRETPKEPNTDSLKSQFIFVNYVGSYVGVAGATEIIRSKIQDEHMIVDFNPFVVFLKYGLPDAHLDTHATVLSYFILPQNQPSDHYTESPKPAESDKSPD